MRIYGKFRFKDSLDRRLMKVCPLKDFGQNEVLIRSNMDSPS